MIEWHKMSNIMDFEECLIDESKFNKIDTILLDGIEYDEKIKDWVSNNWEFIKKENVEIKNIFGEIIFKIFSNNKDIHDSIVHFKTDNDDNMLVYAYINSSKFQKKYMYIYKCKLNFKGLKDCFFLGKDEIYDVKVSRFSEVNLEKKQIDFYLHLFIPIYFFVLTYITYHKECVIRETRTHTKKYQSKKDKRAGKKPKVKLIKQNIITLNIDDVNLTEEELRHYERHILGWTVRGHWRKYKSGKEVWIKPHVKGDKDNVEGKVYTV